MNHQAERDDYTHPGDAAMRTLLFALPLLAATAFAARSDEPGKEKPQEQSGADFLKPDNWEGLMEYWKIEGSTIVGQAPEKGVPFNTFLCTKKKYKNFKMS